MAKKLNLPQPYSQEFWERYQGQEAVIEVHSWLGKAGSIDWVNVREEEKKRRREEEIKR